MSGILPPCHRERSEHSPGHPRLTNPSLPRSIYRIMMEQNGGSDAQRFHDRSRSRVAAARAGTDSRGGCASSAGELIQQNQELAPTILPARCKHYGAHLDKHLCWRAVGTAPCPTTGRVLIASRSASKTSHSSTHSPSLRRNGSKSLIPHQCSSSAGLSCGSLLVPGTTKTSPTMRETSLRWNATRRERPCRGIAP
jgi:hypothetical protein